MPVRWAIPVSREVRGWALLRAPIGDRHGWSLHRRLPRPDFLRGPFRPAGKLLFAHVLRKEMHVAFRLPGRVLHRASER